MSKSLHVPVCIVGAGPIGIELAVALKKRGIEYIHIEAGCIGSTVNWYAPETLFFSSPDRIEISGVPLVNTRQAKASREEYLAYLRSVVAQFELPIRTYERVVSLKKDDDGTFLLSTTRSSSGVGGPDELAFDPSAVEIHDTFRADKVVLAIGDMHRPNPLGIPGEDLPHVSHYFEDPHRYFGKRVLIVGAKNSAVEAAVRLVRVGAQVSMSYRGAELDKDRIKYWLYPEVLHFIKKKRIVFYPHTTVREVELDSVYLESIKEGIREPGSIDIDFVLLLTGYQQDNELFVQAGVNLLSEQKRPELDPETMESNVQGLFVAGTAIAGTQLGGVKEFIETSHIHVDRIIAAISGEGPPERRSSGETGFLEN